STFTRSVMARVSAVTGSAGKLMLLRSCGASQHRSCGALPSDPPSLLAELRRVNRSAEALAKAEAKGEGGSLLPRRPDVEIVDALHVGPRIARLQAGADAEVAPALHHRREPGRRQPDRCGIAHRRLLGLAHAERDLRIAAVDQRPAAAHQRAPALARIE